MTLEEKIKNLPARPGVYLMKNVRGRVIYVGKAKSLKNRVRSYFQAGMDPDPRKAQMAGEIADFETVVTASEMEAFILESNLIKRHKPRYNVVLRDDKNYPYLRLGVDEEFPSLSVTRKVGKDGALYFGPYVPTGPMWETLNFINRNFKMRKCNKKEVGRTVGRPCLQFGMKRCAGPCGGRVEKAEYAKMVEDVRLFLSGKDRELVRGLERRMDAASREMNFEAAAHIRDLIAALRKVTETQRVFSSKLEDRDVVAVAKEGAASDIQVLFVRKGKLLGRKDFYVNTSVEASEDGLLTEFINQFYSGDKEVPPEVLVSHRLVESGLLEEYLREKRGGGVRLACPERGSKLKLVEMAADNARESLRQRLMTEAGRELTLLALKSELGLSRPPRVMEAFDVSNIGGREAVGSVVRFVDTAPEKSGYRHFRIKGVEGANDFAMMREIIMRRYGRLMEEQKESGGPDWPDLIIIDGGKGQLSAALDALRELGADTDAVDVVGLAKAREKGMKYAGVRQERAFERVFARGDKTPRVLSPTSAAVNLLARVRDESHRFAINYHRKLRGKKAASSPLDSIPGIGKKRKNQLLRHFGSLRAIREAGPEELASVPGLPSKLAELIYGTLRKPARA